MLQGFKEFISRGNAVEIAVGMVIGAAFTSIVTALVDKVINPLIGGLVGKPNFDSLGEFTLGTGADAAHVQPGAILTAIVNFLLVALALYFFVVVPMNKLAARMAKRVAKTEQEPQTPVTPAQDIVLLTEIRDLLAKNNTTD